MNGNEATTNNGGLSSAVSRRTVLMSGAGLAAAAAAMPLLADSPAEASVLHQNCTSAYRIGTFYFNVWDQDRGQAATKGPQIYGPTSDAPRWWDGVSQHLTEPGPWGYGPYPEREPMLGWYDDNAQTTIDQQILQAASRGLDHFSFYYYWANGGGGERPGQQAIYNYLNSPYNDLLDFYLYVIADGGWPASDWASMYVPKIIEFVSNGNYMKTADGRPIIGFFGNWERALGGATALAAGIAYLRQEVLNAGFADPVLLVNAFRKLSPSISAGFDGFLPLNLAGLGAQPGKPIDYALSYPEAWENFVVTDYPPGSGNENYEDYLFVPGGMDAFDLRPWRELGVSSARLANSYMYTNPNPTDFRTQLQNVKDYLDSHSRSMNMATFYAWNEFGEGGVIEPSTLYGFGYLNAMQEIFSLRNAGYRHRVRNTALTDLDPDLRIELAPARAAVANGEVVTFQMKVTNRSLRRFIDVQATFDTTGWSDITGNFLLGSISAGESKTIQFTATPASASEQWTKHTASIQIEYRHFFGAVAQAQEATFVVVTPTVFALVQRADSEPATYAPGSAIETTVNIRNHSTTEQAGDYTVSVPDDWTVPIGGSGAFDLLPYDGHIQPGAEATVPVSIVIPNDATAGEYTITTQWNTGSSTMQSTKTVTIS